MYLISPKSGQSQKQLDGIDDRHSALPSGVKHHWDITLKEFSRARTLREDLNRVSPILRQSPGCGSEPKSFIHLSRYIGVCGSVLFNMEEYRALTGRVGSASGLKSS